VVSEGGNWSAQDFSPDGKRLLVTKYVSPGGAAESYPGVVDVRAASSNCSRSTAAMAAFAASPSRRDGRAVYFVSDEPLDGRCMEFQTLRYHDPATGRFDVLTRDIPWDVDGFTPRLRTASTWPTSPTRTASASCTCSHSPRIREVKLPTLPIGVIGGFSFSPDGKRLAPHAQQRDLAERRVRGRPRRREARRAGRRAKSAASIAASSSRRR
jgi:hypothetical protein